MLYACDKAWWKHYRPDFAGIKVTQDAEVAELRDDVHRVPSVGETGLSLDPLRIHQGANSGYQALNLAVLLGGRRIVLLGYDMRVDGRRHWHRDHPPGLNNPSQANVDVWREMFATTLPSLEAAGVDVINCSPGSALEAFPRARLEDVL